MKQIILICLLFVFICAGNIQAQTPLYKNSETPIEDRIEDLLGRMTLMDKVHQLDIWHPKAKNTSDKAIFQQCLTDMGDTISDGIGFLQFDTNLEPMQYAANFNAIQ